MSPIGAFDNQRYAPTDTLYRVIPPLAPLVRTRLRRITQAQVWIYWRVAILELDHRSYRFISPTFKMLMIV